jgi:hypothetical protein
VSLNGAYLSFWQLKHMKLISSDWSLMVLGISKFLKHITLDYQDRLNLMHLYTIFLNVSTKYVLCNKFNTPLTYSTSLSINPNMRELHQDISRYKLKWHKFLVSNYKLTFLLECILSSSCRIRKINSSFICLT